MTRHCFFIGTSWSDQVVANHFKALGTELVARGHRVLFLVDGRRLDAEDHTANPAVYTWPSRRPVGRADFAFLQRLIRRERPDCLIANFGAVNVMMAVGRLTGVPVRVAWYHTVTGAIDLDSGMSGTQLRLLRARKRLVYGLATHLVAVSEAAVRDLQVKFAAPHARCRVWPVLLADPLADDPAISGTRLPWQVVCVGGLSRTKGQDVLLRAMPPLVRRFPRLQVAFVGAGPEREAYEALARELGLGRACCFTGAVPHREALARLAHATLAVVPSRADALALVNVEALAMGTPVVASRVGGIGEVIRDGIDGFLVPPDDPAALGVRIEQLLAHPAARESMSAAARQRFLDRSDLRTHIGRQADWYESLAAGA